MLFHTGTAVCLVLKDLRRGFNRQFARIKEDQRAIGGTCGSPAVFVLSVRHHLDIKVYAERNIATKAFSRNLSHCLAD